jgi:nitrogenase molybdenum-iron protein NifN
MFDRIGAGHQLSVGYRGTRDLIFDIANLVIADREENHQPTPDTWRSRTPACGSGRGSFIDATERSIA